MELKKKMVEKPDMKILDFLKDCKGCVFGSSCFFMPNGINCRNLINIGMQCFSEV